MKILAGITSLVLLYLSMKLSADVKVGTREWKLTGKYPSDCHPKDNYVQSLHLNDANHICINFKANKVFFSENDGASWLSIWNFYVFPGLGAVWNDGYDFLGTNAPWISGIVLSPEGEEEKGKWKILFISGAGNVVLMNLEKRQDIFHLWFDKLPGNSDFKSEGKLLVWKDAYYYFQGNDMVCSNEDCTYERKIWKSKNGTHWDVIGKIELSRGELQTLSVWSNGLSVLYEYPKSHAVSTGCSWQPQYFDSNGRGCDVPVDGPIIFVDDLGRNYAYTSLGEIWSSSTLLSCDWKFETIIPPEMMKNYIYKLKY